MWKFIATWKPLHYVCFLCFGLKIWHVDCRHLSVCNESLGWFPVVAWWKDHLRQFKTIVDLIFMMFVVFWFWNSRRRVLNCKCAEGFFKGGCTTTIAFQNDQMFQNNTAHRHMFCKVARFSQTTRHGQEWVKGQRVFVQLVGPLFFFFFFLSQALPKRFVSKLTNGVCGPIRRQWHNRVKWLSGIWDAWART